MSNNVRPEILDFVRPDNPNFKASGSVTQRIYPVSNVFTAKNGLNQMTNNLEFLFTVPTGFRLDASKSYIMFDTTLGTDANPPVATTNSGPAPNICSTFFATGRLEVNDYLVAQSNNVAQDDLFMKRILNSYTKNVSVNSVDYMFGTDTERFNAWQTILRQQLAWRPDCLIQSDQVFPENTKLHITLTVHPNLNTAASCPSFVSVANGAGDGLVYFSNIYMVNTYVRVDLPTPNELFLPAYSVKSTYQIVSSTSNSLQYTIPKETYKIAIALQSSASTVNAGQTNKFSSGTGVGGAAQSAYSLFLTGMQLRYAGQMYPASQYVILESATATASVDAYMDYLGATDAMFDPSGQESYLQWKDPVGLATEGLGRIFLFNIVKPANNVDSNAELTIEFSTAPTTTRVILFALTKTAIGIKYGQNKSIQEVTAVPFD